MKRLLVVGINPASPGLVLHKGTMKKLSDWLDHWQVNYCSFVNCIQSTGEYKRRDIDFDTLSCAVRGYDKIIALGSFPSWALLKINVDHYRAPHPSGLNRQLNDPKFVREFLDDCYNYIHGDKM